MMHTQPHERFSAVLALAPDATGAFARVVAIPTRCITTPILPQPRALAGC